MSKTITTSYLKAKYKGKYYYLAMYCTYSIDSTDFNSKSLRSLQDSGLKPENSVWEQ